MAMNGKITISRPSRGDGKEIMVISLRDNQAKTRFVEIELGFNEFTQAVTGVAETPCEFTVKNLERVGKVREIETMRFPMPDDKRYCKETAIKLAEELCPEGWVCDLYFNSQNSFFLEDGVWYATTTLKRWVQREGEEYEV